MTDAKSFHIPSVTSFVLTAVFIFGFFVVPHPFKDFSDVFHPSQWWHVLTTDVSAWDPVSKVFKSLFVVVIALIVFVAESIRGSRNTELRRILLRNTYMWPLVLLVTLTPLGYLYAKPTGFAVLLAALVAFLAIRAFASVLHTLIGPDTQERDRRRLLKERVRPIIMESVQERVGNNILFEMIGTDKTIKIDYSIFGSTIEERGNYVLLGAPSAGILSDINIKELSDLVDRLERAAQHLGFSLYREQPPDLGAAQPPGTTTLSQGGPTRRQSAYLLARYRKSFPPNSIFSTPGRAILALPKAFAADTGLIAEVRRRLGHIFVFSDEEPSSFAFRRELQGTKDQLVAAIHSISLGAIDELRTTYIQIAEFFLETLYELGGVYSAEQAEKERGNFFEGWTEIRWLERDIRELLIVAAGTNNSNVIGTIAYLPISIATRAVQIGDHFLFRTFLAFSPFIYSLAFDKATETTARAFMIDRSWRYLKELSDFYILPKITMRGEKAEPQKIEGASEFAIYVLRTFLDLLKSASDRGDVETFRDILDQFFRLYQNFTPKTDDMPAAMIETLIARSPTDADRVALQTQLSEQRQREQAEVRLTSSRDQFIFTLAARLLSQSIADLGSAKARQLFDMLRDRLPNDLGRLTQVYVGAGERASDLTWQWDVVADGEAHYVDTRTKPNQLFCVRALQLLERMEPETIAAANLPHSRPLSDKIALQGTQGLDGTLSDMQQHLKSWRRILAEPQIQRIDALRDLLQRAKRAEETAETERLKVAEIDPEKLAEFKISVREAMLRAARLRPLMARLGAYNDLTADNSARRAVPSWGFNQLDDKAAFIKDWHVHYGAWGENYGRGLAASEDETVFADMLRGVAAQKAISQSGIVREILSAINGARFQNPIIVHTLSPVVANRHLSASDLFIPKYDVRVGQTAIKDLDVFAGTLNADGRLVPVCRVFLRNSESSNKILIGDIARFASWHQYSPSDERGEDVDIQEFLFVRVVDLNKDDARRNGILGEHPPWLETVGDKEGYLRMRVVINVYEKFKLEVADPEAAVALIVEGQGDAS